VAFLRQGGNSHGAMQLGVVPLAYEEFARAPSAITLELGRDTAAVAGAGTLALTVCTYSAVGADSARRGLR
jgi:hypothetical protein